MLLSTAVERILDMARWAPSGDNTQPWRFEVRSERHVVVHGFDTRDHCVYDLEGRASQLSLGVLLETLTIAATVERLRAMVVRRRECSETQPTFDVRFEPVEDLLPDPLNSVIRQRSVQRRAMRTRPLSAVERQQLEASVGAAYRLVWFGSLPARLRTARLMFNSAKLRLTMPEAYRVHRDVIQWGARYSEDRVPDQALGIDALTMRLMKHVMRSWRRVEFFNHYLAGTWLPRIQMDFVPGIACAAHFVLVAARPAVTLDDHIAAGRAVQRFWLTATQLGLELQPELTPLIFARYARDQLSFSSAAGMSGRASDIGSRLSALIGEAESRSAVFMGRLGAGPRARARSTRKRLEDLLLRAAVPTARGSNDNDCNDQGRIESVEIAGSDEQTAALSRASC